MPLKKFNQLQDEFFTVSKRMHEATGVQEKLALLNRLQEILKESKAVLEEIHQRHANSTTTPASKAASPSQPGT